MSTNPSATAPSTDTSTTESGSGSPYAGRNWWGEDVDGTDDQTGHDTTGATASEQAAWKAHRLLANSAPALCGLARKDGIDIELTAPDAYPPADPVASQLTAVRVNEETGALAGGFGTWVELGDQPRDTFMEIVEACLDLWRARESLRDRECDRLREQARQQKAAQDTSDVDIIADLTLAVTSPGSVEDYYED
ncbi:hypothetical protein [Halosegnis longus]|uniref:hypothetical protein n=1 Tax=Halosegnis longus TaxID=2216012 RepID=UPI00129DAB34|nr:hypothetical protein [Halosegnis longus]